MRLENRSLFKPKIKIRPTIDNKVSNDDGVKLMLYDEISWWGIKAEDFINKINEVKDKTIHLHINSPGGSVFDGTAIYNALKQHKSKVIVHIDGLAASIASVIAMAGDEIQMSDNAFLMIHEPYSLVIGTADDMRKEADLLDKVNGTIAQTFVNKTGKTAEEIKDFMAAETWFTAQEAFDAGFIDVIDKDDEDDDEDDDDDKKKKKKNMAIQFDLSAYAHVPDVLKEKKGEPTARDLEKILRDAGCSAKRAKEILAKGYDEEAPRDVVEPQPAASVEPPVELRDVVEPSWDVEIPEPPKRKDRVAELLTRAERIAPTKPESNIIII